MIVIDIINIVVFVHSMFCVCTFQRFINDSVWSLCLEHCCIVNNEGITALYQQW